MTSVGLTVGGWFASAVISRLVTVASTYIEDYFKGQTSVKKELKRLEQRLPKVHSVVEAAARGQQQISDPLEKWLWQLKDALYEADDVLDELDYLQLKQQVEEAGTKEEQPHRWMSPSMSKHFKYAKEIFEPDPTLDKLKGAVNKLDEVAADVDIFFALLSNAQRDLQQQETQLNHNRETGPLLTVNKVFGRKKERDKLVQWLTMTPADQEDESDVNFSLFSLVGHGGMGKTTLAQLAYNDEIVQNSFDLKIWVCVSTSFDVKGLTRSILEYATKGRPNVDGLPALQDALKEKLKTSGKFLLVLDDVWNDDNSSNWDKLLAPLKYGHKGSKILLTTRMDKVAYMAMRAMGATTTKEPLKLGGLHGEDFVSLFNHYAFAGVDDRNYKNLQCIGMQIAKRLGSSPLAAKTIGALLNSNLDDMYWTNILQSKNISDQVQHGEDNIMSILMLSYHHLPLHLRPCFAYCSMFPKDHRFRKEELVRMWMAVGLIQHSHQNQGEMLEDVGGYYFDELLRRSLLDQRRYGSYYVMHDLLHDLAQSVSQGECYSFVDNDKIVEDIIPNTVRHLYFKSDNPNHLTKMDKWHNLRSLVLIIEDAGPKHFSVLEKVFKSLKSIRMLYVDLGYARKVLMPDDFSHLIHLRSLEIENTLHQFPKSLCKLYHLQVIDFGYKGDTIKLPESMNNLVNLRHLSRSFQAIAGVGKLIFLQELTFSVKKEGGYKIGELGDLIWLRSLDVNGLENVENQEEASMAKLCNKKYLHTLSLGWSLDIDPEMDKHESVLDRLQPHSNLKKLTIKGYRGIRYANWTEFEMKNNIHSFNLCDCSRLDHLPPLGKLPFLKELCLKRMPAITKLDCERLQLEVIDIEDMEGLEELAGSGGEAGQWCPRLLKLRMKNCSRLERLPPLGKLPFLKELCLKRMPLITKLDCECLQLKVIDIEDMEGLEELVGSGGEAGQWCPHLLELGIKNCSKLEVLPSLSLSIKRINVDNLGLVSLPTLWLDSSSSCSTSSSLSSSSSLLENLGIKNCGKIASLCTGLLLQQHYLTALKILGIWNCPELVDFPAGGLQHLRALEHLSIGNCPKLQVGPYPITLDDGNDEIILPPSLRILRIVRCGEMVRSMPILLKGLVSLDHLHLKDCEELMSLEGLMGLQHIGRLEIEGCPKLVHAADTVGSDFTLRVDCLSIDDTLLLATRVLRNLTSVLYLNIIDGCNEVETIDGHQMEKWLLQNSTTLKNIEIDGARSLKSLPGCLKNLSSLKQLNIYGASETLVERCRKDEGADCPYINHIPYFSIESTSGLELRYEM